MSDDSQNPVQQAADRVVELESELEAAGEATLSEDQVARAKAVLTEWVETVVGVVASPGVGRVTLIHANGTETKIASPELPFLLSKPVSWAQRDE